MTTKRKGSGYAKDTPVHIDRTINEIRTLLRKFGATDFGQLEQGDRAVIIFRKDGRMIRFTLPFPPLEDYRYVAVNQYGGTRERSIAAMTREWEQACADRWRSLLASIKGKLISIDDEIETFEEAFMAHVVLDGGGTVGEWVLPQLDRALPPFSARLQLLPAPGREGE